MGDKSFKFLRLKEAEDARSVCISIESLECSKDLIVALLAHADAMTEIYRNLNRLISEQVNDEASYAELFQRASNYSTWYKARKKVANSMKSAAVPAAS